MSKKKMSAIPSKYNSQSDLKRRFCNNNKKEKAENVQQQCAESLEFNSNRKWARGRKKNK